MQCQWIQSAVCVCFPLYLHVAVKALKIAPARPPHSCALTKLVQPRVCVHHPAGTDIRLFTTDRNVSARSVFMFHRVRASERDTGRTGERKGQKLRGR